jgi:SAM-dependent methyltransferase
LSIVNHRDLWMPLRDRRFEAIDILAGSSLRLSADALAIAAHLSARVVRYYDVQGNARDVTSLLAGMRVNFHAAALDIHPLESNEEMRLRTDINKHYVRAVVENAYDIPQRVNRQTVALEHFSKQVGLAQDLMMRVPEICENPWWSLAFTRSGKLVRSVDHRLAYAQFLERLDKIDSALEVGCGSGWLPIFLRARGKIPRVAGVDAVANRVRSARLFSELAGVEVEWGTASVDRLPYRDREFDVVYTCYTLEQCQEILDKALDELCRVARRYLVMYEPSTEAFTTLPGLVHIHQHGYPTSFVEELTRRGLPFSILRPELQYYYNPGAWIVVTLDSPIPWHVSHGNPSNGPMFCAPAGHIGGSSLMCHAATK